MQQTLSPKRALLALVLLCAAEHASATNFYIPSLRWLTTSAPWWPKSHEECQALSQTFSEITQQLSAQHQECLNGAPSDEGGSGNCSKASCQPVHDAMMNASQKASEENRNCRERLSAHLEKVRQKEAEERKQKEEEDAARAKRKAEDDAAQARRKSSWERQEREEKSARERQERDKRNQADRNRSEQEAKERQERVEREANERLVQDKRDQAERSRIEREAKQRQEQENSQAALLQALAIPQVREALEARAREVQEARLRQAREAQIAEQQRAQQAAEQRERDKRDMTMYDKLVKDLASVKEIKGQLSAALDFAKNPFMSVAELTADAVASSAVNLSVNPFLSDREGRNSTYELTAMVVDSARSRALAGNPFADRISGMAMDGVNQVHRRVLGEADAASQAIRNFNAGGNSSGPVFRPSTPAPRPGGNDAAIPSPASYPAQNPFNTAPAVSTYYDPDSGASLDVPAGHVLYRDPETTRLSVVNLASLSHRPASGDRPELGEKGCGNTGVGIVTVECEKKRRQKANPFKSVR